MTTISIELVPRSRESIDADLRLIATEFPGVRTVNIPDLLRFPLRSWEACAAARRLGFRAIPHLRAMDFALSAVSDLASLLEQNGLREVLVVQGDPPQDLSRKIHPTTSASLIEALKRADPSLEIYAAFDPYRRALSVELDAVREKLDAGAAGLFTQPFFDLGFADLCADWLPDVEVYWGISPVLSAASRRYWEVKNRALFPSSFEPSLAWNRALAERAVAWARGREASLYFMPIRVDLAAYLSAIV